MFYDGFVCMIARFEDGFEARRWEKDEEAAIETLYGMYQPTHGEMIWYSEDLFAEAEADEDED